jgi:hypothetical protein
MPILADQNVSAHSFSLIVGSDVLTAFVTQRNNFGDMMLCCPFKLNLGFEGTYCVHLQSGITSRARNQPWKQVASRAVCYVPPKRRLNVNELHGVISQTVIPRVPGLCPQFDISQKYASGAESVWGLLFNSVREFLPPILANLSSVVWLCGNSSI